jgi:hypothetical protein
MADLVRKSRDLDAQERAVFCLKKARGPDDIRIFAAAPDERLGVRPPVAYDIYVVFRPLR